MKINNPRICLHCSQIFKSRNALFDHLRSIGVSGIKPPKTYSEIQEARRRRRQRLSFRKFILRVDRLSINHNNNN